MNITNFQDKRFVHYMNLAESLLADNLTQEQLVAAFDRDDMAFVHATFQLARLIKGAHLKVEAEFPDFTTTTGDNS